MAIPRQLPNAITIVRILCAPVFLWMLLADGGQDGPLRWWAAILFIVAIATDGIDGYLARRYEIVTDLGKLLDPIADKALIVSIYITLAVVGAVPVWLVVLVVARDLMIVAAVILSWLLDRPLTIAPIVVSKLNTAAQISFAALALGSRAFGIELGSLALACELLVALLTVASMTAYLAFWLRHMAG